VAVNRLNRRTDLVKVAHSVPDPLTHR
jgi:hypothetical protein